MVLESNQTLANHEVPQAYSPAEDGAGSLTPFEMTISSSHTPSFYPLPRTGALGSEGIFEKALATLPPGWANLFSRLPALRISGQPDPVPAFKRPFSSRWLTQELRGHDTSHLRLTRKWSLSIRDRVFYHNALGKSYRCGRLSMLVSSVHGFGVSRPHPNSARSSLAGPRG